MAEGICNFMTFCSIPGLPKRPLVEKPTLNIPPYSSYRGLACVSGVTCKSIGFLARRKRDFNVVLRVSQHETVHFQQGNWVSMDFKSLVQERSLEAALEALYEMDKKGVSVDSVDLVELLQVCEDMKLLDYGKKLLDYVTMSSLKYEVVVFNELVEMLCKLGDVNAAQEVFDKIPERNLDSWNKMLLGLAQNGDGEKALEIFSKMKHEDIKPDGSTFVGVKMACGRRGAVEKGREYFVSMSSHHGITPSVEHYAGITDLLGRSGKIVEAKEFIANMPIEPSPVIWETLQKYSSAESEERFDDHGLPSGLKLSNKKKVRDGIRSMKKKVRDESENMWPLRKELKQIGTVSKRRYARNELDNEAKEKALMQHSERLAIAYGLISTPPGTTVRIIKNLRICGDCHNFITSLSKIEDREIIVRDNKRFHHFKNGKCSCGGFW